MLVPEVFRTARKTMGVVKMNLAFTALGFLPPLLAAAAQSLPDMGILVNSARLLRLTTSPPEGKEKFSKE